MSSESPKVIWTRTIDWNAQRRRRNRFLSWYVAPTAALILIFAIASGLGEALGLLILLGGIGLMIGTWVYLNNLFYRMKPELLIDQEGKLLVGRKGKPIDLLKLESWFTRKGVIHTSTYVVTTSRTVKSEFATGVLVLCFAAPESATGTEIRRIIWPYLLESDLESLREALAPHIDAPWQPIEEESH